MEEKIVKAQRTNLALLKLKKCMTPTFKLRESAIMMYKLQKCEIRVETRKFNKKYRFGKARRSFT